MTWLIRSFSGGWGAESKGNASKVPSGSANETGDFRVAASASRPLAQAFHVSRRAVAEPAVKLGLVFQLLAPGSGDDGVATGQLRLGEAGHVAPQLFELRHREHVL